jgi:hypothetical protein
MTPFEQLYRLLGAFEQLNERSEVWKDSDKATTFIERMLCNSQRGD